VLDELRNQPPPPDSFTKPGENPPLGRVAAGDPNFDNLTDQQREAKSVPVDKKPEPPEPPPPEFIREGEDKPRDRKSK
jgi:hypothetical protein